MEDGKLLSLNSFLLNRTNVHNDFMQGGTLQWFLGLWSLSSTLTFKVYLNLSVVKSQQRVLRQKEVRRVLERIKVEQKFKFSPSSHWDTIWSIKCLNDAKNYFDPNSQNCTHLSLVFEFKQTLIETLKRLPLQ